MIVTADKISKGSFFKLIFTGFSLGFFVFFLFCGIAALFGAETVHYEQQAIKGGEGLLVAIVMWPFFSFFVSGFFWLFGILGLWLYSFYKPLEIRFKGNAEIQSTDA